ncbi:thiopeptide-type bacteriocin biosynthesis protein [Actinomadura sp. DC4]|uniref:thiopeptide-type bacteriocin biosynthesis protein n=1 Tax=Actinomadura sp. DC4 TaxID=3055069 RepID=UPI0025B00476|nr:thiopeptide-type bacteriocin biosynthesis protein [Actinomadura sp. DC4]MDN3352020.1 thiopeptide-type bacteriocin biosynthesis protein [Actinomadura sp. DC4]
MNPEWLSFHVFYAANSNPILVEGVTPVVRRLREEGLVDRWFFIRYWLEGPHVRLRMLPSRAGDAPRVRAEVLAALEAVLARRPALYETDRDSSGELFKRMYLAEYSEERWNAEYGEDGEMPYRANNSVHEIAYRQELDRYGGPAGMALSEWHFERSSDLVLRLLATGNMHMRTVLLGQTAQLDMALCFAFLRDDAAVATFLENYRIFWETSYQEPSTDQHETFDRSFERMRDRLEERLLRVRAAVRDPASAAGAEREWAEHCLLLRDRATSLARAGELSFRNGPVTDPAVALPILLSSYVHMTANRLGASILDEIYLAYVNRRAVLGLEERQVSA